ncbi:MAG: YybH family protein, partial [Bacillota bacterium]
MRNRVTIIILYVFCLSIIPSFIYAQGNLDQAKSKIKEINGKWENYLKDGNQQALLDLYADDAYLLAPNSKTIKGKDAIKEHYSTESSDVQKFTDVKFSTTDVLGQND